MCCDAATAEAAKTQRICKDLKFTKDEDVLQLVEYVNDHRVVFTAADFLEINRRTLLSMAAVVTNYLIVVLQFNRIYFN